MHNREYMYNHNKGKLVCNALNSLTKEIYIMTSNHFLNYTKCSQTCTYETRTYHIDGTSSGEVCKGKIKNYYYYNDISINKKVRHY